MAKYYLFTGEETYLLHKELKKRKEGFLTKYGPDTVLSLSLGQYSTPEIIQALCSSGLFSENKLIIVSGIPGETTSPAGTTDLEEQIINHREQLNPDYFIIFISYKPDKRKKSFKFFSEHCELKHFAKMDMRTLPRFINDEFQSQLDESHKTISIDKPMAEAIVDIVGDDGRNLAHEVAKLAIATNNGITLSKETLENHLSPLTESNSFGITESLLDNNTSVYHIISNLEQQGESRQAIQGSLLWGLKSIVAFGLCNIQTQDPKGLGLPPFTLSKYNSKKEYIIGQLSAFGSLYHDLIDYDYQTKNGISTDQGYRLFLKEKIHTYFFS